MVRRIAILSLLLAGGTSLGEKAPVPPVIPEAIAVPEGYVVVATFEAKGKQIYKASLKGDQLGWGRSVPKATLYDSKGKKAGTHYAGPTWEAEDGSKLVLDDKTKVKGAPSRDPKVDVPLLRLEVKAKGKVGVLNSVGYVLRLNTRGGLPPRGLTPEDIKSEIEVPYTATYVFYAKKE
jgi:hypothetical protein